MSFWLLFRVLASPWTPAAGGKFQLEDTAAARRHWERLLPPDSAIDILMTHGPPRGVADVVGDRRVGK